MESNQSTPSEIQKDEVPKPNRFRTKWPQEPEIPTLKQSALPAKIFYSLEEAAGIAKCTSADLLHLGSMAKIRLLIPVPGEIDACPCNAWTESWDASFLRPEMLAVAPPNCRQIELNGSANESDFREGYHFEEFCHPRMIYPHDSNKEFSGMGCVWRTFHQETPQKIQLTLGRLFVMSFDLDAFLQGTYKPEKPESTHNGPDYKSEELRQLNRAAFIHWGKATIDDPTTHPKTHEVEEWLIQNGFSKSMAKKGASIIRPEFAIVGRPSK